MLHFKRSITLLLLVGILVLTGCTPSATSSSPDSTTATSPSATEPMPAASSAAIAQLPRLNGEAVVEMVVQGSTIRIRVDGANAPITAGNFVDLVNRGVYNGLSFHRVVRQPRPFVVQGGDPQSKDPNFPAAQLGTGGFVDPDTKLPRLIPLEIKPEGASEPVYSTPLPDAGIAQAPVLPHRRGAVAMARSALADSASSQFYFALTDLGFLDGSYAVFGYVEDGMDVIDQINQGDRIDTARVVSGLDNLTSPSQS